jgi:glyoxylase-like metal-dependent hydrolase (beta-lactamase superfamily II)
VLVDAMTTVAEAEALANWVALHNRNLETIYITHAHFDHFFGLSVLLDRFPMARAIATPKTVKAMQMSFTPPVERLARRLFPGQLAAKFVAPEAYERDTFTFEGHELRIIEQGHTDSPDTTSLHVPSIGLIVAGDVVYNHDFSLGLGRGVGVRVRRAHMGRPRSRFTVPTWVCVSVVGI